MAHESEMALERANRMNDFARSELAALEKTLNDSFDAKDAPAVAVPRKSGMISYGAPWQRSVF